MLEGGEIVYSSDEQFGAIVYVVWYYILAQFLHTYLVLISLYRDVLA